MTDRKIILRASLKVLSSFAFLWLVYIFMAGFFINDDASLEPLHFDLTPVASNSAVYFKADKRELLVVKHSDNYAVFWANDPIYGCRLEFLDSFIKPVCIDIRYDLRGDGLQGEQRLLRPEYSISSSGVLSVFP